MKVLDPQAALLTTVEVHQFMQSSKPRPVDKKIGAYKSVNLHNHVAVRQDLGTYISLAAPHVLKQEPIDMWMSGLVSKLKKYDLTKTEVLSLVNLGVGSHESSAAAQPETNGNEHDDVNGNGNKEDIDEEGSANGDVAAPSDSSIDRLLFGLVVEESGERFREDEGGEERIAEIINILKESVPRPSTDADEEEINDAS